MEEEPDEDIGRAPALAHHHHNCILFDPSVGGAHLLFGMRDDMNFVFGTCVKIRHLTLYMYLDRALSVCIIYMSVFMHLLLVQCILYSSG